MKGDVLALDARWVVGKRIGAGGFGQVFAVAAGEDQAVAKFVPKTAGADRELLFVGLDRVRNVVPVIDSGEHEDNWVIVMPRAELSLRDYLDASGTPSIEECVVILDDITAALADLDGKVVHRDLKPENVLRLDGHWCLADFGISRYAEAATAPDTRKFALSPYYAAHTESERRADLAASAARGLSRIADQLRTDITASAPSATVSPSRNGGWTLRLNTATLTFNAASGERGISWGGWIAPPFDIVSVASVNLRVPADRSGYEGRSHSVWFGDLQAPGEYGGFETAFMVSPLVPRQGRQDPFALDPGEDSAKAVWPGMAEFQVAWPFTRLEPDDLTEFISRWAGWLASAATGRLSRPSMMPERSPDGSWRRS